MKEIYNFEDTEEYSFTDFSSICNFVKNNYVQIFMLFLVFIIIFIVDHISNINAVIFGMPSPIPVTQPSQPSQNIKKTKISRPPKKNRK